MSAPQRFETMKRFKDELKDDEKNKVEVVFTKKQQQLFSLADQIQEVNQNLQKGQNFVEHVKMMAKRSQREYQMQLASLTPSKVNLAAPRKKSEIVTSRRNMINKTPIER